jgi:mycothiol synthase
MRWEQVRVADAAAWAQVVNEAEEADHTGEHYDADDLTEELEDPGLDLATATMAAWDGDRLAGLGLLRCAGSADPVHRVFFDGVVRPAYRRQGIGAQLLAWAIEQTPAVSQARHPGAPFELHAQVGDTNDGKRILFEGNGFTPQRYFFAMRRPLDTPLPPVQIPGGYQVEAFDPDRNDEPARQTRNAAFLDHWGTSPQTPATWKQWFTGTRAFRPDLSFVATADGAEDGELAALLLTHYYGADTDATGRAEAWVSVIGTRRGHRRKGVAGALLASALHQAREAGMAQVGLGVDAANPTGALGFYESAGFTVTHRDARYVKTY